MPGEADHLAYNVLDAMPQQVAVVDKRGIILLVNQAWVDFARSGGVEDATKDTYVGDNYFRTLEHVKGAREDETLAERALSGIRAVLDRQKAYFSLEYPCHSPQRRRWFVMEVTRLSDACAVITHSDISYRILLEKRLAKTAHQDELTGLASRAFFDSQGANLLALAERYGRTLRLISMDLDDFRAVNDAYGHIAGDQVLLQVTERLQAQARRDDLIARTGRDAFLFLIESDAEAETIGLRFCSIFGTPFPISGGSVRIGASVGVACFPQDGQRIKDLLRVADERMYVAKRRKGESDDRTLEDISENVLGETNQV